MRTLFQRSLAAVGMLAVLAGSVPAATFTIINNDGPGEGFNDPTPAAPVGGNPGLTIGQQRLNCFQQAANIWGALLTSSQTIVVRAAFNPLSCNANSGVLGSCGPRFVQANDPAFEFQGYWYHIALANKQAAVDFVPPALPAEDGSDMSAQFNSNLGQANCVAGRFFYYGFDHNEGNNIDLLAVLLHEFGHGLGFSTVTSGTTGNYLGPPALPAVFDRFLFDETTGLHWDENTPAQRVASAVNTGNLTWDGEEVTFAASTFLALAPEVAVPFGSGTLAASAAAYGPQVPGGGLAAEAVVVDDGIAAALNSDACESPFVNSLAGKIAVIDRGTCTFTLKSKNAQLNGAVGVIIVNNAAGDLAPGGADPTITIPTVGITQADGLSLKTAISGGTTNVTLQLSDQRAGMHPSGRVRMFAPNPFQGGSSVSHWDVTAFPNLQMEPAINADLTSDLDLTVPNFKDIGWIPHTTSADGSGYVDSAFLAITPNPGRGALTVRWTLASEERVELALYDVNGRQVRLLARGTYPAGPHDLAWDGRDDRGRPAAPGVYLARLKGTRTTATHPIVLID